MTRVLVTRLTQALRTLLSATADEGTDCTSLETFIRNGPFLTLERNSKSRDAKLKKVSEPLSVLAQACYVGLTRCSGFHKRTKALLDVLSRFETCEKVLTRSGSELGHEKKRIAQLEERRKLDRAEEIEKVEIDLRRTRSSLSVKRRLIPSRFQAAQCSFPSHNPQRPTLTSRIARWLMSASSGSLNGEGSAS